jgi:hypothetical protein
MAKCYWFLIRFLFTVTTTSVFCQTVSHGSAVILYLDANNIVIGADSKTTHDDKRIDTTKFCKIRQAGKIFFAVVGVPVDTLSNFDLIEIITRACADTGSFQNKIANFDKLIYLPSHRLLKRLRSVQYNDTILFNVIFFGFEDMIPFFIGRDCNTIHTNNGEDSVVIVNVNGFIPTEQGSSTTGSMGSVRAVREYLKWRPKIFEEDGIIPAIKEMIQVAIYSEPDHVGLPIDILWVTRKGAKWIERKQECAEIKN